jgi:hypothetical protein
MGLMGSFGVDEERPVLSFWSKGPLWLRLLIVLLTAALAQFAGYGCGRAIDCSPGQQDGQCGLGTGMGMLMGAFGAALILIVGLIGTLGEWLWRRRREQRLRASEESAEG